MQNNQHQKEEESKEQLENSENYERKRSSHQTDLIEKSTSTDVANGKVIFVVTLILSSFPFTINFFFLFYVIFLFLFFTFFLNMELIEKSTSTDVANDKVIMGKK